MGHRQSYNTTSPWRRQHIGPRTPQAGGRSAKALTRQSQVNPASHQGLPATATSEYGGTLT